MSFYETKRNRNRSKDTESQVISRTFVMRDGSKHNASRVVVPHSDLKRRVEVHPLNPRYQEALTEEALEDILPSIKETGVIYEGIAENIDGKFLVLDSSRRLAAAEIGGADLPLWVFEEGSQLSRTDAEYLTEVSRLHRPLSRREHGLSLIKAITEDESLQDFSKLIKKFRFKASQERTVRRYISAAVLPQELIDLFPDSEGIPNDYYDKLKSICKAVGKSEGVTQGKLEHDIPFFERLSPILLRWLSNQSICVDASLETADKQAFVLNELTRLSHNNKTNPTPLWSQPERIYDKSKYTYAELTRHSSGKEIRLKCRQLSKEQEQSIIRLIASFN
ncbi:hypothetical protein [Vibrio maritimus]|uniref:hypothetical protein n=1 Tax=Vibrio maritimus TaxID=990268 RepID=UPI0037359251